MLISWSFHSLCYYSNSFIFYKVFFFIADWERPKDLNGIDARVIIFWGYVFGMVLPIGLVAFRGYII